MADPNSDVSDFEGFSDREGVDLRQELTIDSDIELEISDSDDATATSPTLILTVIARPPGRRVPQPTMTPNNQQIEQLSCNLYVAQLRMSGTNTHVQVT